LTHQAYFWGDLTSADFHALDPEKTITILPVAAVEQHGPHLPVLTDTVIADGMLGVLRDALPPELSVLVLPTQSYGKSDEHILSPGTLTLDARTLIETIAEIGAGVARAGLRKLVLMSSHGGNSEALGIAARDLRLRHGMLCVATHWHRFGLPDGVYTPAEQKYGIHAGDIETSLMLHFRPDLVRMDKAKNFVSSGMNMEKEFTHLRTGGPHAFAWLAQDLNPDGAVGDATSASADKGRRTAEHQVAGFIALLRDMTSFSLNRLHGTDARR
jgi:creatinine amidohydrolase